MKKTDKAIQNIGADDANIPACDWKAQAAKVGLRSFNPQ